MEKKILTRDQLSEEILQRIEALGMTDQIPWLIKEANENYGGKIEILLDEYERADNL